MKRFAAFLLAGIFSCTTATSAFAVATNGNKWARPALELAYEEGLFTESELQRATAPMSRLEFCKVMMRFLHIVTGEEQTASQKSPFQDCDDADVIAAYEAGIINGIEPGIFAPEHTITREQMAIMLAHALTKCGMDLETSVKAPFSDISTLYPASVQYINQLYALRIFSGYANGTFAPFREMSIQEAAASFVKAYDQVMQLQKEPAQPMEESKTETPTEKVPAEEISAEEKVPAENMAPAETDTAEKQEIVLPESSQIQVTIAGKTLFLGMTEQELETLCGAPLRIDQTVYTLPRYIYQPDAQTYFFVTFADGKAVEIFTPSKDFRYLGIDGNATAADVEGISYMSAIDHSAVIADAMADARFQLDYANNFSGFWLQTPEFLQTKTPDSTLLQAQLSSLEAEFLDIIQTKRSIAAMDALQPSSALSVTAKAHSKDMVSNRFFAYNSKTGDSPFQRIQKQGKSFTTAAEVIAKQRGDVVHIYLDWIRTPSKIGTLQDPSMKEIGIGISSLTKELYVTVDLCG